MRAPEPKDAGRFPCSVPAIAALAGTRLTFATPITFLVGENGSGKSTLLEALALAIGSIAVGSQEVDRDKSLQALRPLADRMKLIWQHKTRRGFFLRAEDFFGFAQRLQRMREEYEAEIARIDADTSLTPMARGFARLPFGSQLAEIRQRYGPGLEKVSHGESFLHLFQSRFTPNGLYLLDEPEAPLSPMRQLALVALLKQAIKEQGAQCIIATHSPIILATPHATILEVTEGGLIPTAYDMLEHVRFTRDFLNAPEQFLQHL